MTDAKTRAFWPGKQGQRSTKGCGQEMEFIEQDPKSISNKEPLDTVTAIKTRKSVRKYTEGSISDELLGTVLNAGFCAPSAHNRRPWHFIVIRDRDRLNTLADVYRYSKMLKTADLCIAVCADKEIQSTHDFLVADCCAAIENMLLCAHSLGLGGVWIGVAQNTEWSDSLRGILELPERIVPAGLISLGIPDTEYCPRERYESSRVHKERFGS
jgi:nitroreductase